MSRDRQPGQTILLILSFRSCLEAGGEHLLVSEVCSLEWWFPNRDGRTDRSQAFRVASPVNVSASLCISWARDN